MAARSKVIFEFWLSAGLACVIFPPFMLAGEWMGYQELLNVDERRGHRFEAVMTRKQRKQVVLDTGKNEVPCHRYECEYPSSNLDVGVKRWFTMVDGWLLKVEREGQIVDVRSMTLASKRGSLKFFSIAIALCVPCFAMAYFKRPAASRDNATEGSTAA